MNRYSHLSVAIPMMAESDNIERLLECLRRQTFRRFSVYVCVNQPEAWRGSEDGFERWVVADNEATLQRLREVMAVTNRDANIQLNIIDKASEGNGWSGKQKGVGWARKLLFDKILEERDENEAIVSMDADTDFADNYFEGVIETLNHQRNICAISTPYYHPLSGEEATDRRMLRYECYMRHYLIQMLRIGNPYAFTALGSSMAFPAWAYRRVGGITPLQGGEDFYLMQKFAKTGQYLRLVEGGQCVRPQGRVSHRVPFGTGPAVALDISGMDEKYPFYAASSFDKVRETYALFPTLYERDEETPMTEFLRQQLGTDDLWAPLRKNFKTRDLFVHACMERVDGLRILQYLKALGKVEQIEADFENDSIEVLDAYRNRLFGEEMVLRNDHKRIE